MIKLNSKYELLAPAKNKETAIAAINAGADAIYIGYSKFGARKSAGNSLDDIREIVQYADIYRVNVYVTLNTIYNDNELIEVQKIIYKLYDIGVSAIIIQDMGILELELPPIKIFASTQCHNNTLEKIKFLEQTGIERVILPREFSLSEIKNISDNSSIEIESFIHGALCVSYSGQCYLSYVNGGRSANRGECAQPCRKKYTLISEDGEIIAKDKYLLSLKDLNLSDKIEDLILAGVTSFKIEGRLKDLSYVTNVVSYYRQILDKVLEKYELKKSSLGKSYINFEPNPYKSFNRDFTDFYIDGKRKNICTKNYVKSLGEYIGIVDKITKTWFTVSGKNINNGDGICFFKDNQEELLGTQVQKNENNKIFPVNIKKIKKDTKIYRNLNILFYKETQQPIQRKINITAEIQIFENEISLIYTDEEKNKAIIKEPVNLKNAINTEKSTETIKKQISKTGDTEFEVKSIVINTNQDYFLPISILNNLRRKGIEQLRKIRNNNLQRLKRKSEIKIVKYPILELDYKANILNKNAEKFYEKRSAKVKEYALEKNNTSTNKIIMTCKHCIKYTLNLCPKYSGKIKKYKEPFYLLDETNKYQIIFDCKNCQMSLKITK